MSKIAKIANTVFKKPLLERLIQLANNISFYSTDIEVTCLDRRNYSFKQSVIITLYSIRLLFIVLILFLVACISIVITSIGAIWNKTIGEMLRR